MVERQSSKTSWRYRLGLLMFVLPFPLFVLVPAVVPFLGFTATEAAAIIGATLLAMEVIWFLSIPLLGKVGFKQLKQRAFGVLKLPDRSISQRRHYAGVTLLLLAVLIEIFVALSLVVGYFYLGPGQLARGLFGMSFEQEAMLYVALQIVSVVCLVAAVYTLGTPFFRRLAEAFLWHPE
jgi:hypothetical protein